MLPLCLSKHPKVQWILIFYSNKGSVKLSGSSLNDKSIAKISYFFRWSNLKEAERFQNITMPILVFSDISLRKTSKHLLPFVKRNPVSIWNWIKRYKPTKLWKKRRKVSELIIDEILIKVERQSVWLRIAIEPIQKVILDMRIYLHRSITCCWTASLRVDLKIWKISSFYWWRWWYMVYPQACKFLQLDHHTHSSYEKGMIERTIQYTKDRTECFN